MLLSKRTAYFLTAQAAIAFLAGQPSCQAEAQATAPGNTPSAAVSMYNLGLKAYKEGTPESAIIFFTRACDINPDLADAQYNLGVLYQSQKRCKEAIPRFQQVLRVKPQDTDAHYQVALCLIDMGQLPDARTHLSTIAPNNPHFADAQKRLSMLDGQQNMTSPAQPVVIEQAAQPQVYQTPIQPTQPVQPVQPQVVQGAYTPPPAQAPQQPTYQQPVQPQGGQPGAAPMLDTMKRSYGSQAGGPVAVLANTSVRVIATGFSAPAGLAFDKQGNLYVANFMSSTVDRVNVDGSRSQFSSGSNLKGPIGLVVDGANCIYVANYLSGTIARISPSGVSTIIATGFKKPYYLTLDKEGNLFVSQQEDNTVVRITLPKGNVVRPM